MTNYKVLLFFLCLLVAQTGATQSFSSAATRWSDTFTAWELYGLQPAEEDSTVMEEVLKGTVQQRWLEVREDWTEWDFTLDGQEGTIKLKWKNDPSEWELRSYDSEIITMKTIWNDDFTQWRITDNSLSLDLKSRYTNDYGEWSVNSSRYGNFKVAVARFNDPRDWEITDQLDERITPMMKLAIVFIVTYHASPKQ